MSYDLYPLPREYGYLGIVFGVSYHSYLSTHQQPFPIRDSVSIFTASYQWAEEPSYCGSHNTGYSYELYEGLLSTVVIIPSAAVSGTRDCSLRWPCCQFSYLWDYLATVVRVPVFSYQWDHLATAMGVPVFSYQWVAPDNTGIQSE